MSVRLQWELFFMRKIDCHVHLVGDGSSASGCWFRLDTLYHRLQARLMLRGLGIDFKYLKGGLDDVYVETLASLVRTSSLDAVVLLAQDIPYDDMGNALPEKAGFYVPNEYLFDVIEKHPDIFIPAVSIHPGRQDAMEELQRCIDQGARVLKLLPNCLNIDYTEARYIPFWECMEKNEMILLSHTGGEKTLPVMRPEFADPLLLRSPLECGVAVIAAHSAGRSGIFDADYTDTLLKLFKEFPHCYGDNSALCSLNRARTLPKIITKEAMPRLIHGSDYPVPIMGSGPWMNGVLSWKDYRRCRKISNVVERDYQLKRAMGFSEVTFTRMDELLKGGG
ncbi:MAG: amidohydrolase family protein [Verrucomicrobia bacterium]|nr:amidohydrolase family protein [Verrucomicrobiota bacterium]